MLTSKQVKEIREHLEKAQNPVFFFDNDQDGLCSFLLLRRFIERGKGVAVRSFPEMDKNYFRKVNELEADYIFILDKPVVNKSFFDEAHKYNIPVVMIDHHETQCIIPEFVNYFNPFVDGKNQEAVAGFCYQITQKKKDLWIAIVGCVSDYFIPDFYSEFKKQYPDLSLNSDKPFDIFYGSGIGKVGQIFGAGLKDTTTKVVKMLKFLIKVKSPYEILDEENKKYSFYKRFELIDKKIQKFIKKAIEENKNSEIVFFKYGGDMSISRELAETLRYKFPNKTVVVGYESQGKINISIRGEKIKNKILKVLEGFENATGGGHENAIGVSIQTKDWDRFVEEVGRVLKSH